MSKISDVEGAKSGLSGLFGKKETDLPRVEEMNLTPEELIETFEDVGTRDQLRRDLSRRQYQTSGRPRKGEGPREVGYTRRTYLVKADKAERLSELSVRETKFLKELLDEALDLLFEKYNVK